MAKIVVQKTHDARAYITLSEAITAAGVAGGTVHIVEPVTLDQSATVSGCTIKVTEPGYINLGNFNLTFDSTSRFDCPYNYQAFYYTGSGVVSFASESVPYIAVKWLPDLSKAVAAGNTILLSSSVTLTANYSGGTDKHLIILRGGLIISATYSFEWTGTLGAGNFQVFSGFSAGNLILNIEYVYPQWIGTTIATAISALGSSETTLKINISIDSSSVAEAVTIPANISVNPIKPGIIDIGSATLLTLNGPVVGNPMHQWLSGFAAGEVTFGGNVSEVKAVWLGTTTAAIQLALASNTSGGIVEMSLGLQSLASGLSFVNPSTTLIGYGTSIMGQPSYGTRLKKTVDGFTGITGVSEKHYFKDFTLDCDSKTGHGIYLQNSSGGLEDVAVYNVSGAGNYGIYLNQCSTNTFRNVTIKDCNKGLYVGGTTGSQLCSFYSLRISDDDRATTAYGAKLEIENTTSGSFYGCVLDPSVSGRGIHILGNCTKISFFDIYMEAPEAAITIPTIEIGGSGNKNISFNGLYINHSSGNVRNMITLGNGVYGTVIENSHFLNTTNIITAIFVGASSPTFLRGNTVSLFPNTYYVDSFNHADTQGINIDGLTNVGGQVKIRLYGSKHSVRNCKNVNIKIESSSDIIIENIDVDSAVELISGADSITLISVHSSIIVESGCTNIVAINCTGSITGAGAGVVVKLGAQAAANADTSLTFTGTDTVAKADVVLLQTEVNEMKATLRTFGLIAT